MYRRTYITVLVVLVACEFIIAGSAYAQNEQDTMNQNAVQSSIVNQSTTGNQSSIVNQSTTGNQSSIVNQSTTGNQSSNVLNSTDRYSCENIKGGC